MRKPDPDPPFQLDFTPRFEAEVEILLGLERGAEVLEGLEAVLRRNPHLGTQVPETDVFVRHLQSPGGRGQFSVYYRIEGRGTVVLLSITPVSLDDLG